MKYFFFSGERMASNGAAGRAVVTSTERAEGHEAMDEEQISDEGISSGHGTFVAHTGDVRGHGSAAKQHMSAGKVGNTISKRLRRSMRATTCSNWTSTPCACFVTRILTRSNVSRSQ
jgi:hypothetical protein